jgi:hypothetical protein
VKIEVGKTYKDGKGHKVKIVVNLDKDMPGTDKGFTFIGQNEDGFIKAYNSEGTHAWSRVTSHREDENLIPNVVKKEGWVNLYKYGTYVATGQCATFDTEQEALRYSGTDNTNRIYLGTKKIEWEEEDV